MHSWSDPRFVTSFLITDQLPSSLALSTLRSLSHDSDFVFILFSLYRYSSGDIFIFHCLHVHKFCFSDLCNLALPFIIHWNCSWPLSTIWHWPFLPHNTFFLWLERYNTTHNFFWIFFTLSWLLPFPYSPSSVPLSPVNFIISCQICSVLYSWCHFWSSVLASLF